MIWLGRLSLIFLISGYRLNLLHMNFYNLLYLFLLGVSFALSLWCVKNDKTFWLLSTLLGLSILTELAVYFMYFVLEWKPQFFAVYHIYIPLEYTLLSYFLTQYISSTAAKRLIFISIPIFIIGSLSITILTGPFIFPGSNLNAEGILIIVWTMVALFSIKPISDTPIFRLPIFWISVGLLVYYAGGFFFNFTYQYLQETESALARVLNGIINKGLNYILYTFMIIAFLCSNHLKRFSRP